MGGWGARAGLGTGRGPPTSARVGESSLDGTSGVGLPFFPRLRSLAAPLASGEWRGLETPRRTPPASRARRRSPEPFGGQGRAGAGPRTDSFRPVRLSKMPQTSGGVRGGDGQAVFMGGCPLGGLVLLGRGSGRNEAGMRASPAPRSSAKIPGAPCPVRGVCRRSSKCQQRRSDPQGREHRHQATQPVPKKLLHQHRTGA